MDPPAEQHIYWDAAADRKRFGHPFDHALFERWLADVPRSRGGRRVLDLGCGYGRVTGELRARAGGAEPSRRTVLGLDGSLEMLHRGRRAQPELDLAQARSTELPTPADSFDAAVLFSVWTCLPSRTALGATMAELRRVLKPGGLLYVSDLLLQDDERNRARYAAGEAKYGERGVFELDEGVVLRHFPRRAVSELLHGFEERSFHEFDVTTMNGHGARGFQVLATRRVVN